MVNVMQLVKNRTQIVALLVCLVALPLLAAPGSSRGAEPGDSRAQGAAPVVLSISPTSGPTAGGTVITIAGANLLGADYVDFDGQQVIPSSVSGAQVQVTSPPHASGVVHLRVHTATGGLSGPTAADNYRYSDLPVVTSVTPSLGSTAGGGTVTIHGTNLAGAYQVYFGETVVTPWQVAPDALLVATPGHAAGTVDVRVRTGAGLSATSSAARYTYVSGPPVITAISPTSGPTSGGTVVTITGTGFSGATAVSFGGFLVAPLSVTDTRVTVMAPGRAAGTVNLRVVTSAGMNGEPPFFNFTYVAGLPVIVQISPRGGPVEGGTLVTITGTGFSTASTVRFGDALVTPVSVSETEVRVASPPHAAGLVHLRVTTNLGTSQETFLDDYTYGGGGPRVAGVFPKQGPTSGGTMVTVTGSGFSDTLGVVFGDRLVTPSSVSATELKVVAPPHAAGVVHLRVITPGGASPETPQDDYTYGGGRPIVSSISPGSGSMDGGALVTITGSGFTGAKSVSFGDVAAIPISVSENQLQVVAPAVSRPGVVHLRVLSDAGVSVETEGDNFTYLTRPTVTGLSPRSGSTAGGTLVVLTGFGFTGVTIVNFGGVGAFPAQVTDTEIRVVSPAHAPGVVHLRLTSAGGVSPETAADDFTYVSVCPEIPLWVNDLAYGSPGGGFYWDPVSGQVWTGQRSWHLFAPQPPRAAPQPLWVNALGYGSIGGGFYWDPVSGQVWTAQRGWHLYSPEGCVAVP